MEELASKTIEHAVGQGAEFADLRLESYRGTNIVVMDGRTKTVSAALPSGCGIRAFIGGAWGFAVTNDISLQALASAAESAVKMAKVAQDRAKVKFRMAEVKPERAVDAYRCAERPSDVSTEEKVAFASSIDRSMRSADPRIVSTNARYDDFEGERVVANSFGTLVRTSETWTMAACSAWAKSEGVVQRGHASVGSVGGYELMRRDEATSIGGRAAAQALRLLDSKPAPAGKSVCILDNRMTGLLAHEAMGHACEADAILAGGSVLEGRIGQRVAVPEVTLVDDPTIESTFGHFVHDWEGVRARRHVLIDGGVLGEYLHSLESSSRMGLEPNGASRAHTYGSPPLIRMSNTFIAAGDWGKDELIEDTREGLLFQGSQYGYVEPSKGQFMFKCDEAYEIRRGELGQRYRDASLSGVILEVLNSVTGVADDFLLGDPGYCGKNYQDARTTDGGPHMRVADVVVGGLA
ncbi:MAG: TldD/PmbA family protein [Candidatus Thermoplasmatota archaeon]